MAAEFRIMGITASRNGTWHLKVPSRDNSSSTGWCTCRNLYHRRNKSFNTLKKEIVDFLMLKDLEEKQEQNTEVNDHPQSY